LDSIDSIEEPAETRELALDVDDSASEQYCQQDAMAIHRLTSLPPDHPLNVALRTYALALSLSLGPALASLLTSNSARVHGLLPSIRHILRRELAHSGFPFAITVAIGGGAALQHLWRALVESSSEADAASCERVLGTRFGAPLDALKMRLARLAPECRAFACHLLSAFVSIVLMQARRRHAGLPRKAAIPYTPPEPGAGVRASPTLDLSLLIVVRALDALVQLGLFGRQEDESAQSRDKRRRVTTKIDAFVFWASSARCVSFFQN
jgi:hypothetical protein